MTPRVFTMPSSEYRPAMAATIPMEGRVIRLSLDYEIEDWCRALRCSEWRLREAVHAVGPGTTAVRSWLHGRSVRGALSY